MAAYLMVDIEVTNPQQFEEYRRLAPAAVAKYGGRYIHPRRHLRGPGGRMEAAAAGHRGVRFNRESQGVLHLARIPHSDEGARGRGEIQDAAGAGGVTTSPWPANDAGRDSTAR